eukprot:11299098-Karenia_brevis.AAC.1
MEVDGEGLMRRGVSMWLDELVGKEGQEAAKHRVAQVVAEELVEKAKRLSSKDVEMTVPKEIVEEAQGSSSSAKASSSSSVRPKSPQEIKR